MGTVVTLIQPLTVDQAWQKYVELAAMVSSDYSLLLDRSFHQDLIRAHQRWAQLFLADDGQ